MLEPGQFSKRGGIMDIWAPAETLPVRLDFFGDEIETIRRFDPASQRTVEKLNSILITPAREFIASGEQGTELSEFHIPLLHQQPASLLDYLPQKAVVLIDDLSIVESMAAEVEGQAVKFRHDSIAEETLSADFPLPYIPWSELHDSLHGRASIELGHSTEEISDKSLAFHFGHDERFGGRLKQFVEYTGSVVERGEQVIVVSRQSSRLHELWLENQDSRPQAGGGQSSMVEFIQSSLSEGFTLGSLHLITDSEVFGWERPQPRTRQRPVAETPESIYADLQIDVYVVHICRCR